MVAALPDASSVLVLAPAKLNVFLELHRRRADGFHELETVMVAIDRFDRLRLRRREDGQICLRNRWAPSQAVWQQRLTRSADTPGELAKLLSIPAGDENLVYRALAKFRQAFAVDLGGAASEGFDVDLEKQTPAGAGMGGASSDAAAAVRAAAALHGIDAHDPRLWELASQLGSDVPFFLGIRPETGSAPEAAAGGCRAVLATGRGEQLSALAMHGDLRFVICYPPQSLSTAKVYQNCTVPQRPQPVAALAKAFEQAGSHRVGKELFNRLAEPSQQLSSHVERLLREMQRTGLLHVQMTGSGSACFGLAANQRSARRAAQLLSSRQLGVAMVARSVPIPWPISWQTS